MRDEPFLAVENLTAGYGGPPIIEDISMTAKPGTITVFVGPNGAGKSTLMKALAGVIRPMSGTIRVCGEVTTGLTSDKLVKKGLSYVPQVANVFPSLTILENLQMGGYTRRSGLAERIQELYGLFPDLAVAARRPAGNLSGGQRNMLALAQGLVPDPKVLLVDEPTAGLAPKFELAVWEHIVRIRDTGVAVVVVEQNTRLALSHANWGYVLALGKTCLAGSGYDLLHDEEVVSLYIGADA